MISCIPSFIFLGCFFFRDILSDLPEAAKQLAAEKHFALQAYRFVVPREQLRPPRVIRIGLVQNAIIKPTSAPLEEQVCAARHSPTTSVSSFVFPSFYLSLSLSAYLFPFL